MKVLIVSLCFLLAGNTQMNLNFLQCFLIFFSEASAISSHSFSDESISDEDKNNDKPNFNAMTTIRFILDLLIGLGIVKPVAAADMPFEPSGRPAAEPGQGPEAPNVIPMYE
jgi:hypothetical protein